MTSKIMDQEKDLTLENVGDAKYTLVVFDHQSKIDYQLSFKTRKELEDRMIVLFSVRHGVPSPKVLFLLNGDQGEVYPHINDRFLVRADSGSHMFFIERGRINPSRILFVVTTHDN